MKRCLILGSVLALLLAGCSSLPAPQSTHPDDAQVARPGAQAPSGDRPGADKPARISGDGSLKYTADGPYPIDLADVPVGVYDPFNKLDMGRWGGRLPAPISDEAMQKLREEALSLAPNPRISTELTAPSKAIAIGTNFDSLDYTDCCGGGGNVPPDPEIAVGPNHIIAVVNVAFEIYDKSGTLLAGPTTFSSFFAGTPGCSNTGVFDPNVLYDESADRFILGIDGNGTDYCIAATTGSDPTSTWNRFAFPTDINNNFFDFPHAGVGLDAIYMGSNQFGAVQFAEARVFAIEKAPLYSGGTPQVVTQSTGNDSTPQPMNLHGFAQGTWPSSGPHYIMTEVFDGVTHTVWAWNDPFGANSLTQVGDIDLGAATGVPGGAPIDWPQLGTTRNIQGNDFRGQSTEYRNGFLFFSTNLGCNPGGGTVNCVRWAKVDPTVPSVVEAGVFGTDGEYRTFPNVAANHCEDMAIGYTKGSASTYPAVYMAGREAGDPAGTLQTEQLVKAGEITYSSFETSGAYRWGDYTGLTIDPDGTTFWYLGEYSKNTGTTNGRWGTYIGSFSFAGCSVIPTVCGDNVAEGNEVCDGTDLAGATCGDFGCTGGGALACNATCDGYDTSGCFACPACDFDLVCELGEDCNGCPTDCPGGTTSGASCGNGVCETADGENCVNCSADCNGTQGGRPSNRFCCGDGGGTNPVDCSDARCTTGGFSCTNQPANPGSFCCGDLVCDSGESCATCALDCATGVELCTNGVDDDCNGATDCDDLACSSDPACQSGGCTLGQSGDACSSNGDCCSGRCKGNGTCK